MRFLNDLTSGEMIAVTEQWTGPLSPVFVSIPELAPLLPRVTEDHDALVQARAGSSAEVLLRTLSEQADFLDTQHDHLQRALHLGLRSAREAALGQDPPDTGLAALIEDAQERLFPQGLEVVKASYESEAGNAAQMVHLAKTELSGVLAEVPIAREKTALDLITHLGAVGAALGSVEQKKSVAAGNAAKEEIAPAEIRRRMRAWAQTVETVQGALERTKAGEAAVEQIRKPVVDAAEKARGRRLARRLAGKKREGEGGVGTGG